MLDAIAECEKAGYADGLAAGLAQALTGVDVLCPPGPVAAVPAAVGLDTDRAAEACRL